jgi:uncharacterized cupredoxin-like copper-binding protein
MQLKWLRLFTVALVMVGFLAACGDDDDDDASGTGGGAETEQAASKVTVKTLEYAYDMGDSIKGGLVAMTLDNSGGKESHEAELARLDEGKTLDDFKAAMDAQGPPPTWYHAAGGSGPVSPGETSVYTANLDAGTYVIMCHVPAASDGKEHAEHGMIRQLTVTEGEAGELPDAQATVQAKEFEFVGLDGLRAGEQTVRFENTGQQQHFAAMATLAEGKTVQDLLAYFSADTPPPGPPPFTGFPGFMATFDPGQQAVRTLKLEPGTYAVVCFIPDTDGTPHAAKGMAQEFKIT